MWYPVMNPGKEKKHLWETDQIQIRPAVYLIVLYPC